ncbi:MAG: 3',5'-cyclic-nucleotide phosphodiesterase [Helicobacteraceae bacterium]|jgi:oligoribonuclease NrnB/cAMP/cGMP phosphodiesterase (DHH superfamily)|nr:3',5'-cyclic-nucleotide phosphodiesterase [Helicobacteraceae bacterium]
MGFNDLKEKLGKLEVAKKSKSDDQNYEKTLRLFHLSHNDLDGYACQLVTKRFFEDIAALGAQKVEIRRFNSGYGAEISAKIALIAAKIAETDDRDPKLLLISDLNISREECKFAEKTRANLRDDGHEIELRLLDHHKSGEALAKEFEWYFLDIERSATKIVYEWCAARYKGAKTAQSAELAEFVACVNAYDLWKTEEEARFEFGKAMNRLILEARELSDLMFAEENNRYRLACLNEAFKYLEGYRNVALDDDALAIKKNFLQGGGERDTIDNLAARFIVELLSKNSDRLTVYYSGEKGMLTYMIGNSSVLGNEFLRRHTDFSFFMNVDRYGNVSLRSNNKIDVSQMAEKLFGGGGHANAAGGKIQNFKEVFTYKQLLERIKPIVGDY